MNSTLLQDIIDQSDDAVIIIDKEGKIHYSNHAFVRLLHYAPQSHPRLSSLFKPSDYLRQIEPGLERAWQTKRTHWRLHAQLHNGAFTALDIHTKLSHANHSMLIVTLSSITHQVDIEHALLNSIEESEQEIASIIDNIPIMIVAADADNKIAVWNRMSEDVLGFSKEEMLESSDFFEHNIACNLPETACNDAGTSVCYQEIDTRCKDGSEKCIAWNFLNFESPVSGRLLWAVGMDITKNRMHRAHAVSAKKEAENANRAKSIFMSNISHEIRTIINAILGYAQLLDDGNGLNGQQQKWVSTILVSSGHLLDLINDILSITKNDMDGEQVHLSSFSLTQMLKSLYNIFHIRAANNNIEWRIENDKAEELIIHTDKNKLFQILINLIGNAIKFTEKGHVVLKVVRHEASIHFEVIDSGIGIDEQMQQQIFEPFVQENVLLRGGTGLGLTIAKRNIELLEGELRLESEQGKGSRFYFDIPFKPCDRVPDTSAARMIAHLEPNTSLTVLIIDDILENRKVLQHYLENKGITAVGCSKEEVGTFIDSRPDLVLMDIRMEGLDGAETTRTIRQNSPDTKVVAISASAPIEQIKHIKLIFDDYIYKPFHLHQIDAILLRYTNGRFIMKKDAAEPGAPAIRSQAKIDKAAKEAIIAHAKIGQISKVRAGIEAFEPSDIKQSLLSLCETYDFDAIIKQIQDLES